jgi:hypothetical protein
MTFEQWRAETAAVLSQWHAIPAAQISDVEWRRRYAAGEQPWQAADWLASAVLTGKCEHD